MKSVMITGPNAVAWTDIPELEAGPERTDGGRPPHGQTDRGPALRIGAYAVINSATENVIQRLTELHGESPAAPGHESKPATNAYLDVAGAPDVLETIASWDNYTQIISDRIPYSDALQALALASSPGATEEVVVMFD